MNKALLTGRFTRDPEVRYSSGETQMAVAKFTLAVNRKGKDKGADFISCTAFGKSAEFIQKYFHKGMKADVAGRIQTGSYEKDGHTVYTTEVIIEDIEFGESKSSSGSVENGTLVEEKWTPADDSELPFADPLNF